MDRRERLNDLPSAILTALRGWQSEIWTALPAIVDSFDHVKRTCNVKPTLLIPLTNASGGVDDVSLPLLLDCPVQYPGGGGVSLTFPLKAGDEVLVVFSSRCINTWWARGGYENNRLEEYRMHDLSDGFIIPEIRSVPRSFSVDTSAAQLRTDDGTALISLDPATKKITLVTSSEIEITAPTTTIHGNVVVDGEVTANGVKLSDHVHSGVVPGGGNSGGPT